MFKKLNGLTPPYLSEMFTRSASFHDYGLRSSRMNLVQIFTETVLHFPEQKSEMICQTVYRKKLR